MRPTFHPRLINGPFDDPGLFVPLVFENRALLFDLGDLYALTPREILKTSHVFVTHTHMDHFVGFDRLLRLVLGRDKHLCIFGPEGLLRNIEGKLAGYTWNLVTHYRNRLTLQASEVGPHRIRTRQYASQDSFQALQADQSQPFEGVLLHEPAVRVTTAILDHRIPSLGFCVEERFHVNILKEEVSALGLTIGPWLRDFKQALFAQQDPASILRIPPGPGRSGRAEFSLGELAARIALISPGQKIGYIADVGWSPANSAKIVSLVSGADHLYIEAAFLERHREVAAEKYHLTARQAGTLAALARVKAFTLFHFSPRYTDQTHLLEQEAREAYAQTRAPRGNYDTA